MLMDQEKLKFYVVIINLLLTKIFVMKRSPLKRKASQTKQQEDITKYKKQRNLVIKLNREMKLQNFNNLETSKTLKHFWENLFF